MGLQAWAPGRVNLIGDHTDYTGGLALPMAIGRGIELQGNRGGSWVMLDSEGIDGTARDAADIDGLAEMALTIEDVAQVEPSWARYVAAVVAELRPSDGITGTLHSSLPVGRGLASSAALEVVVAVALGADLADPVAVAQACQRAEERAVGVPCGIMDQLTILAAVEGTALRLDCRELSFEPVPLPDDLEVAVADSGQHRRLESSPYARRRDQCAQIEADIGSLRDAELEDVTGIADPELRRRALHIVTENQRVDAVVEAFADHDLRHVGELMAESHASMRDDYEISTPQIDQLVEDLAATPGVYGARLTGGGFGGCAVALCDPYAVFDVPVLWRGRPAAGASLRS
jgi:galactokinase